ncbi:unnamed protein product [Cylindrotheca closterium]|uniref:PDZ domain-containing protein n=1 Tax=Cylindrotheca closterium TaxID=2856 RepID=A0AAD2FQ48_9STRA|nr:unnamed protein product [Cylindrotheca closterium]
MLRRIRGNGGLYKDLLNKEPHVVSITFWREEFPFQKDDTEDVHEPTKLGIMIDKAPAEEDGDRTGGDFQITDIQDNPDSLLYGMPIEVGDRLVAVNSQPCYGLDIEMLKQMIATQTGIVTLTLRKTRMAPFQDELRLAVFIDSQKHTCIPMDICLFKEEEKLSIFALYDHFDMDIKSNANKNKNDWLEKSCLAEGQVLLSVNDTPTFQLEEDDAHSIMNETLNTDEVLAIKTYFPSRASANEAPDMADRVTSYIVQLEHRMTRSLAQARNENDDLNFSALPYPVFSSAAQLDKTLRGAYNRCITISTGKPLFRLYLVMEDVWAKYAKVLIRRFPKDSRFSKVWRKRLGNEKAKYAKHENMEGCPSATQLDVNGAEKNEVNDETATEAMANVDSEDEDDLNSVPTFESVETDSEDKNDNAANKETASSGRGWFFSRRRQQSEHNPEKNIDQNKAGSSSDDEGEQEKTEPDIIQKQNLAPNQSRSWFFSSKNAADESKSLDGEDIATDSNQRSRSGQLDSKRCEPKDKEINIRAEICHVICTGSYCLDLLTEREIALNETIEEGFKVDFGETKKVFQEEVIQKGILQLVDSVNFQSEPIFASMARIRWHRCDEVGDTSPYAMEVVDLLKKRITSLIVQLPPQYHHKFKYDLIEVICQAFYNSLARINRISPVGTQQLLLDVCTLKLEFVALLKISEPSKDVEVDSDFADARMTDPQRFVNELLKRPEALLKLAGTNVGVDELLGTLNGNPAAGGEKGEKPSPNGDSVEAESGSNIAKTNLGESEDGNANEDDETTIVFDHLEDLDTTLETPAFPASFDLDDEEPDVE